MVAICSNKVCWLCSFSSAVAGTSLLFSAALGLHLSLGLSEGSVLVVLRAAASQALLLSSLSWCLWLLLLLHFGLLLSSP